MVKISLWEQILDSVEGFSAAARLFEIERGAITLEVTKEAVRRIRQPLTRDEGEDLILRAYMSEDFREGMGAFLNKRKWKDKSAERLPRRSGVR
jgi:enoyl-CoA hydratase/carnithine racemase